MNRDASQRGLIVRVIKFGVDFSDDFAVHLPPGFLLVCHSVKAAQRWLAIPDLLEKAGVEFIPENGGGAGVQLAKRARKSK